MTFQNKNLEKYLKIILNKNIEKFYIKDLFKIETLKISNINYETERKEYDFNEIKLFPFLNKLIIEDSIITNKDIEEIKKNKIFDIKFVNCYFTDINNLSNLNLTKLSLYKCSNLTSFSWLTTLSSIQEFEIFNDDKTITLDINYLLNMKKLKVLTLSNLDISNFNLLNNISNNLNILILKNMNLENLDFLNYLPDNCTVIIDEKYIYQSDSINNSERLNIYSDYNVFTNGY